MATSAGAGHTPGGSDTDGDWSCGRTPAGSHVDALLDASEEEVLKDLEPQEYHCYYGWEEAVWDWARAAPLSCILASHRRRKEAEGASLHDAESSADRRCASRTGSSTSSKGRKATVLDQQTGRWGHAAGAALQAGASQWADPGAMQKSPSRFLLGEEEEEEEEETPSRPHLLCPKHCVSEHRPTEPQNHRPSSRTVPIKNFTFLPPIESLHLNRSPCGQPFGGKKASPDEVLRENGFIFDWRSETTGPGRAPDASTHCPTDSAAALVSKYQTCHHNVFSALPKRYQVPPPSKPENVHCSSCSVGKSLTPAHHSTAAVGARGHLHPSCLFS